MQDQCGARTPKACKTCAKAKVRCEQEGPGACKRCRRLSKECGDQAPGAHRRQKASARNSDFATLEAKLNRMVAILAASGKLPGDAQSELDSHHVQSSSSNSNGDSALPMETHEKALLELFMTKMVPFFPFIPIKPHVTAEQLRLEKPFLYLNISIVACQDSKQQRKLEEASKKYIADHIIMKSTCSLDLLQGLLVHLAWIISISRPQASDTLHMDSLAHDPGYNQLDTFLYLAVAQAITLGLNQENYSAKIQSQPTPYLRQDDLVHDQASARTLEEKRTFLGCYYLTMIYSVCLKDMQPLKFTDYADECCQTLCNASEFPNDTYGVHLVRTMHLAEKILRANSGQESKSTIIISAPVGLSLRGYQSEIKALKASFSCDFPQSATLDFHYNTLEILLYRVSLGNDLSDAQYGDYPVTLLDLLFRCLETTKLFFQNFYSLPSALFPLLPFTFYCQFGQAIVTLSRLSLYQTDKGDWDRDYVQQTLDLDHTVDRLTRKMEEVQLSASCTSGCSQQKTDELPEIYGKISRATKMIKEAHLSRKWAMEKAQIQTEQQVFSDFDFMSSVPIDSFFTIPDFGNLPDAFEGLI